MFGFFYENGPQMFILTGRCVDIGIKLDRSTFVDAAQSENSENEKKTHFQKKLCILK